MAKMQQYSYDANGLVQHLEYVPFGEVFIDERNGTWNTPYRFNGKEQDEETGLYYYGARCYDSKTSVWLSVDPLAEKYPGFSPYVYCANNPIVLVDPNGESPVGAVIEGVGAFVVTAGIDFLSSWIFSDDMGYKEAFNNISWGTAALDGCSTAAISFFIDGTGSAKYMTKIGNSKGGKLAIDIVKSMTVNIMMQLEKGADFNDVNLTEEFITATFSTLVSKGFGKKSNELLESLKDSNKSLYNKLSKLERNSSIGKSETRLKSDSRKLQIAKTNSNANAAKYAKEKTTIKFVSDGAAETGKQVFENNTSN